MRLFPSITNLLDTLNMVKIINIVDKHINYCTLEKQFDFQ